MARQALRTGAFDLDELAGARGNLRKRPRPLTRVLVTIRRGRLDAALAAGADPCESPALAYRAARLTADDNRLRLAAWIANALDAVEHPPRFRGVAIQPHGAAMRSAAPRFEEVYERLRSSAPIYARGVAMLERLRRDGGGPVYAPRLPDDLRGEVDLIAEALEGTWSNGAE